MAPPGFHQRLGPLLLLIALPASLAAASASQQPGPAWRFWGLLGSSCSSSSDSSHAAGSTEKEAPSARASESSPPGGKAESIPGTSQRRFQGECFSSAQEASRATLDLEGLSHLAESGQAPSQQLLERVKAASDLATSRLESGAGAGSGASELLQQRNGRRVSMASGMSEQRKRTCWEASYEDLVGSCREILNNETRKAELALRLTNCYFQTSGRDVITCPDVTTFPATASEASSEPVRGPPPVQGRWRVDSGGKLPSGEEEASPGPLKSCLASLTDHQHLVYLAYFIDCPSICHHLQANAFKRSIEELVNDLGSTATGVHTMLSEMSGQTDEILSRTEMTLAAQEVLREQQAAAWAATESLSTHLGQLQGSLQGLGLRQESIGEEVLSSLGRLGEGTKRVGENVAESLLRQRQMEASQEAAAAALERLQSGQTQLIAQQSRDHQRLEILTEAHQRRTAAWQGQVESVHERMLEGQGRVEEEVRHAAEQHAAAFREQARAMGEVERRTAQYHTETVQWQQQMQGAQSRLLDGQSQVAGALSAAAQDAQRHREAEQEWNRQAEAYHREQAADMFQMKRVTDEFKEDHRTGLRSMEKLLTFMGAIHSHLGFISSALFYGASTGLSLLLTSTARTAAARLPLLLLAVVASLLEWGAHSWVASLAASPYLDTAMLLQETLPALVSALRWLYGFTAAATWVSHASTYRNLAQASHSLLERQGAHFQGLLLALQEVAHHFKLQEQQHHHYALQPRQQPRQHLRQQQAARLLRQPHEWEGLGAWDAQGTWGSDGYDEQSATASGPWAPAQACRPPPTLNPVGSECRRRAPAGAGAKQAAHGEHTEPLVSPGPAAGDARQPEYRGAFVEGEALVHRMGTADAGQPEYRGAFVEGEALVYRMGTGDARQPEYRGAFVEGEALVHWGGEGVGDLGPVVKDTLVGYGTDFGCEDYKDWSSQGEESEEEERGEEVGREVDRGQEARREGEATGGEAAEGSVHIS